MKNKSKGNYNIAKTIISSVVVLMLIIASVAVGFFSSGYRNWNKEDWAKVWKETFENETAESHTSGEEISYGETSAINLNMSTSSEGVSITAEITPSTATNQKVDWSISWNNSESEWAKGKSVTDYVSVMPTSDGSTTATIKANKAFAEQIILTCSARDASNIKSTCTIDYSKKITDLGVSIKKDGKDVSSLEWSNLGNTYDIVLDATYSEGTVEPAYKYTYTFEATDEFIDATQQTYNGFNPNGQATQIKLIKKTSYTQTSSQIITSFDNLTENYIYFHVDENNSAMYRSAVNQFKKAVESFNGTMFNMTITASNDYSTFEKSIALSSTGANFDILVENVKLSDSSIIF